jgi:hypothetical protein
VSVVPGDPASVSACASTVQVLAERLGSRSRGVEEAVRGVAEGWPGRVSVGTRRRGGALAEAGSTTAAELERVAVVLQDHATDLAALIARARRLEETAATAGLQVRDRRVVPAYGIVGEADPAADTERTHVASALQVELDALLARHARRRDWVLGVLRTSTGELAAVSHALRRG